MSTIHLKSSDGQIFDTDEAIAKWSVTMKRMLEDVGMVEDLVIPLDNVSSTILRKILEWTNYHKDDENPIAEIVDIGSRDAKTVDIGPWDADFLKTDLSTLIEIFNAANYLDIKWLQDLIATTIGDNFIKGKTVEEIRHTFNQKNDLAVQWNEQ